MYPRIYAQPGIDLAAVERATRSFFLDSVLFRIGEPELPPMEHLSQFDQQRVRWQYFGHSAEKYLHGTTVHVESMKFRLMLNKAAQERRSELKFVMDELAAAIAEYNAARQTEKSTRNKGVQASQAALEELAKIVKPHMSKQFVVGLSGRKRYFGASYKPGGRKR
jgi:hypothetical protein